MRKTSVTLIDKIALSQLLEKSPSSVGSTNHSDWIRILRHYLRMTQQELASRTDLDQAYLARIEAGKIEPGINTLKRIFEGLSCDLIIVPQPKKPLDQVLRGRARSLALKRLKQTTGSMALEEQAPDPEMFKRLLEQQTDEILEDKREKLWRKTDE